MGLYLNESDGDTLFEGVAKYLAVRRKAPAVIEIWDADGDHHIGNLPADFNVAQVNAALALGNAMYSQGKADGECGMQAAIRSCLGIGS